jgi:hypothetical protein
VYAILYINPLSANGLLKSLKEARKYASAKREFFNGLSVVNAAYTEGWSKRSTEAKFVDGEWQSVYKRKRLQSKRFCILFDGIALIYIHLVPTQSSTLQTLLAEEHNDGAAKYSPHSTAAFVHDALMLQDQQ